jgi:uncharacterized RDD family membrane protein YckC
MKTFSARETVWLQELDGIELAGFRRRAFAFLIDGVILSVILSVLVGLGGLAYIGIERMRGHTVQQTDLFTDSGHITISPDKPASPTPQKHFEYHIGMPGERGSNATETASQTALHEAVHILVDILIPVLYFGAFLWRGNGRTPGKRLMKIRVVSLVHTHMTFWHSVERALGYGAAALEGGFGFIQYFIHPYRRCAQDRLAETIVVTERSYQQRFPTSLGTPPEADAEPQEPAPPPSS